MGAYVSIPDCKSHYNVTLDCSYNLSTAVIGGLTKGEFGSDSDIAGIGVRHHHIMAMCNDANSTSSIGARGLLRCHRVRLVHEYLRRCVATCQGSKVEISAYRRVSGILARIGKLYVRAEN